MGLTTWGVPTRSSFKDYMKVSVRKYIFYYMLPQALKEQIRKMEYVERYQMVTIYYADIEKYPERYPDTVRETDVKNCFFFGDDCLEENLITDQESVAFLLDLKNNLDAFDDRECLEIYYDW